jgi:uncharacterized protein YukE
MSIPGAIASVLLDEPDGDPRRLEAEANTLEQTARWVGEVVDRFRSQSQNVPGQARWAGDAADNYLAHVVRLSGRLAHIEPALQRIASALGAYAHVLRRAHADLSDAANAGRLALQMPPGPQEIAMAQAVQRAWDARSSAARASDETAAEIRAARASLPQLDDLPPDPGPTLGPTFGPQSPWHQPGPWSGRLPDDWTHHGLGLPWPPWSFPGEDIPTDSGTLLRWLLQRAAAGDSQARAVLQRLQEGAAKIAGALPAVFPWLNFSLPAPPRPPDYVTFTPGYTLGGIGGGGAITVDRYGRVYLAPGAGIGTPAGKGFALQAGWVRTKGSPDPLYGPKPTEKDMQAGLTDWGDSVTSSGGPIAVTEGWGTPGHWNPQPTHAAPPDNVQVGIGLPGVGYAKSWGFRELDINRDLAPQVGPMSTGGVVALFSPLGPHVHVGTIQLPQLPISW